MSVGKSQNSDHAVAVFTSHTLVFMALSHFLENEPICTLQKYSPCKGRHPEGGESAYSNAEQPHLLAQHGPFL
jgi:hypothetical protein